jgi:propanediol dehydratase large subunit
MVDDAIARRRVSIKLALELMATGSAKVANR